MRRHRQRKPILWIVVAVLAAALLIFGGYWLLRLGFDTDLLDRSGWQTTPDGTQYLDYHGEPLTGWQDIDGKRFYFTPEGIMSTGWQEIEGNRYYFTADGTTLTGWQEIDGSRYYLEKNGAAHVGWLILDGGTYYLDGIGKMLLGWQEIDGGRRYLGEDGILRTGFFDIGDAHYYADPDGKQLTGWQETAQGTIYLDVNGVQRTFWQKIDGSRYYLDPVTGLARGRREIDGSIYYFDDQGALQTGWLDLDGSRYYLLEDGTMVLGWQDLGQHRYYFGDDGAMRLGWQDIDGNTYYFKDTGVMAIGQVTLDGVNHFFTSKGKYVLLVNPWNPVPADYAYDFVEYGGRQVDRSAYEALKQMIAAGQKAGNPCSITEIYRSIDVQRYLWNRRKTAYMEEGYDAATADMMTGWSVAIPGHSEHQTGLGLDFNRDEPDTLRWMEAHCWEYGFIVRYPNGKMDYTGIVYEPWHYRYVGVELAQELKELGLCMEEYMQMLTRQEQAKDPTA